MDEPAPRFSYQLASVQAQSARQLQVKDETGHLVWDSGWVESAGSQQIVYEGKTLKPLPLLALLSSFSRFPHFPHFWEKYLFFVLGCCDR